MDEGGRRLGSHDGHWGFTPGQRRGLGIAAAEPLYALRTEPDTNIVVVGPRESLARDEVWVDGRLHIPVTRGEVKLRYRSPAICADVEETEQGFRLRLDSPAFGVAPGQAAVVYEDDAVVGAGVVRRDP